MFVCAEADYVQLDVKGPPYRQLPGSAILTEAGRQLLKQRQSGLLRLTAAAPCTGPSGGFGGRVSGGCSLAGTLQSMPQLSDQTLKAAACSAVLKP